MIQAYKINDNAVKQEKEKFYVMLQQEIGKIEENTMIIGDLEKRVENKIADLIILWVKTEKIIKLTTDKE